MSDTDTGLVDSLKVLDPDGRLEKVDEATPRCMSALPPKDGVIGLPACR